MLINHYSIIVDQVELHLIILKVCEKGITGESYIFKYYKNILLFLSDYNTMKQLIFFKLFYFTYFICKLQQIGVM